MREFDFGEHVREMSRNVVSICMAKAHNFMN